jgi:hypothetical protein
MPNVRSARSWFKQVRTLAPPEWKFIDAWRFLLRALLSL